MTIYIYIYLQYLYQKLALITQKQTQIDIG